MSNLSQIYHDATSLPDNDDSIPAITDESIKQPDLVKKQLKINWLHSSVTQEMISSIHDEIEENMTLALELANGYSVNKNADKIVQVLNHINSLKKVLATYVSLE